MGGQSLAVPLVNMIAGTVGKGLISPPPKIFKENNTSLISEHRLKIRNRHFDHWMHAVEWGSSQGISKLLGPKDVTILFWVLPAKCRFQSGNITAATGHCRAQSYRALVIKCFEAIGQAAGVCIAFDFRMGIPEGLKR
ncbi:hypothetical protein LU632_06860 [Erwinia tracheiphila]|nr:hypothetical protein [Erwinia tracheiphila]UIA93252.1 hypothetical protein LU632_06860 [Erwinia tracheiphila]